MTFRAKLKQLKKLSIALGVNSGKEAKILYGKEGLYQWAFCFDLLQFGIDPSIVAKFVRENRSGIFVNLDRARSHWRNYKNDTFYVFKPGLVSGKVTSADESPMPPRGFVSRKVAGKNLTTSMRIERVALINVSETLRHLHGGVQQFFKSLD